MLGLAMPKVSLVTLAWPLVAHLLAKGEFITACARSVARLSGVKELPVELPVRPWRVLMVTLKNEIEKPLITWTFTNAYPVRWEVSPMNAMESAVFTETMELAYHYFEREVVDTQPSQAVSPPRLLK